MTNCSRFSVTVQPGIIIIAPSAFCSYSSLEAPAFVVNRAPGHREADATNGGWACQNTRVALDVHDARLTTGHSVIVAAGMSGCRFKMLRNPPAVVVNLDRGSVQWDKPKARIKPTAMERGDDLVHPDSKPKLIAILLRANFTDRRLSDRN